MLKRLFSFFKTKPVDIIPEVKKYPHELYPELLEWRSGDRLESKRHVVDFSTTAYFVKFDEDHIYVTNYNVSYMQKEFASFKIGKFVPHYKNISLRTRRTCTKIANTTEYENLVEDFKLAIAELKNRELSERT